MSSVSLKVQTKSKLRKSNETVHNFIKRSFIKAFKEYFSITKLEINDKF